LGEFGLIGELFFLRDSTTCLLGEPILLLSKTQNIEILMAHGRLDVGQVKWIIGEYTSGDVLLSKWGCLLVEPKYEKLSVLSYWVSLSACWARGKDLEKNDLKVLK